MADNPLGVLILHGFTSSLDCVSGIAAAIEPLDLPIRMPILRGHSASTPEALQGVRWQDWAEDGHTALHDLMTVAERIIVVGHSMGALVTINLAADHADIVDSVVLAAPAVQLVSPLAPGRPLSFLAPIVIQVLKRWNLPPVYADPTLAQYDTNYEWAPMTAVSQFLDFSRQARQRLPEITMPTLVLQSRADTTVAPKSANIVIDAIATPAAEKRIAWFENSEHEMFRDCEREAAIETVVDYVQERIAWRAA
jgi:carboxylesterase